MSNKIEKYFYAEECKYLTINATSVEQAAEEYIDNFLIDHDESDLPEEILIYKYKPIEMKRGFFNHYLDRIKGDIHRDFMHHLDIIKENVYCEFIHLDDENPIEFNEEIVNKWWEFIESIINNVTPTYLDRIGDPIVYTIKK